jgi:DNA polymerase I-like protein with 3'-5' exonuclease and polymerase domains
MTMNAVALDTETTGAEFLNGFDTPFVLYACDDKGKTNKWEWEFLPEERTAIPDKKISEDIKKFTREYKTLVFHNTKFDIRALESVDVKLNWRGKTFDTLMASHVLNNVYSHKLKDLADMYLDRENTEQKNIKEEVVSARRLAKKHFPDWILGYSSAGGKEGDESHVALDYWIFKCLAKHLDLPPDHSWWTLCDEYGYGDVIRTIELWSLFTDGLTTMDLWKPYKREMKLLEESIYDMETKGLNILENNLEKSHKEYCEERCSLETNLHKISDINFRSQIELPAFLFGVPKTIENQKTGKKEIVVKFRGEETKFSDLPLNSKFTPIFLSRKNCLKLPVGKVTKTNFSADKYTLSKLLAGPLNKKQNKYLNTLHDWKDVNKAIQQLETIQRFKSVDSKIYFSIKQNGTKTTRVSASNPNPQQISKGKEFENEDGSKGTKYKIRSVFGPRKGRVWYCIDYSQLQLRIFAYVANEKGFIKALSEGYDGHAYIASKIYNTPPEKLTAIERRTGKNVNFGFIFGAAESKIDQTAGIPGLMRDVAKMFPSANEFMRETKKIVRTQGYVFTPFGYKLQLPYAYGKPKEHAGVNYIVQGCEGDIVKNAMIMVCKYLRSDDIYRSCKIEPTDAHLTLQVHDELVFDFPKEEFKGQHIPALKKIITLMEKAGKDIGMVTPVDVEMTETNWAETMQLDRNILLRKESK